MSNSTRLATVGLLLACVAVAAGIKCWQCGQYSDGVGSITPCNNRSAAKLNQCPPDAKYCILHAVARTQQAFRRILEKYVSELTVVRDCVPTCSEKEWWGARTFCCETDECNGALTRSPAIALIVIAIAIIFAR